MENRIRSILANLASVGEDLLALSDDIWLDIDHNNSDAVRQGADFKVAYNAAMERFSEAAAEVSQLVRSFTKVSGVPANLTGATAAERERRDRVIRELDTRVPHSLEEDFRYKRPFGFTLQGEAYAGLTAWQHVYEAVCQHLAKRDLQRFLRVAEDPAFTSTRHNKYFSRKPSELRDAREFVAGVFAEVNLSANQIRDNVRRLLDYFSIPSKEFVAYLREDRDAEEDAG